MFSALSLNEDFFASRVSVFVALGPVLKLTHCKSSLIQFVANHRTLLTDTCDLLGIYEFFPANWLTTGAMRLLCGTIPALCDFGVFLVADEDTTLDDPVRLPVYLGHFPSGASLNSLLHYAQILTSDKFSQYDYGKSQNKKLYGTEQPPEIGIQNISKVPIAMFVGQKDELADTTDNHWAHDKMGDKAVKFYKEYNLGHLSFLIANDMSYFTTDVMNILRQYHPTNEMATEEIMTN